MPGATGGGYPYPLSTEPVRDGAQRIRELAETADAFAGTVIDVTAGSAVAVGTGTWSAIPVGTLVRERDPQSIISQDGTSPIISKTGYWEILVQVRWPSNTAGRRIVGWGTATGSQPTSFAQDGRSAGVAGALTHSFRDIAVVNAGQRVVLYCFQDSGVTLSPDAFRIVCRYVSTTATP